jgi:hypothetical protein
LARFVFVVVTTSVIPSEVEGPAVAVVLFTPKKEIVISTEAAHALVSSRAEKSASPPTPFANHPAHLPLPVLPDIHLLQVENRC